MDDRWSELGWWILAGSVTTFVVSLVLGGVLIVRMPADHFVRYGPPPESFRGRHPALRWTLRLLKNLLGLLLLVGGVIMLFTPGQGVLFLLLGLMLLDVPGKRHLELRIVRNPAVLKSINTIRARAGRPPLQVP